MAAEGKCLEQSVMSGRALLPMSEYLFTVQFQSLTALDLPVELFVNHDSVAEWGEWGIESADPLLRERSC